MKIFFDTNVLVYMFDADAPAKQARARELIEQYTLTGEAFISTQVLQEFYVTVTRKLAHPLAPPVAYRVVQDFTTTLPVVPLDANLILLAIHRSQQDCFSFWEALIIEVALKHGATILYTEDLQDSRQIGELRIKNPFL
jgi:predicted nucleic acid-binding protein